MFVWALRYIVLGYTLRVVPWRVELSSVCVVSGFIVVGLFFLVFFLQECGVMWCDVLGSLVGSSVALVQS